MDQKHPYVVSSFGYAVYLVSAGFEVLGAQALPNGIVAYLFPPDAAHAVPEYQKVVGRINAARDAALVDLAQRPR
jgi:hypothetical protein